MFRILNNIAKCRFSGYQNSITNKHIRPFSSQKQGKYYEDASYFHQVGEQPLMYKTLGVCLQEAADKWPDRIWIKDLGKNEQITFSQGLEHVDRLAAGLIQLGLSPGDIIGVCSPNSARWILSAMAAARAGLIVALINPLYQKRELEYALNKIQVKCLLMPSASRDQNYYSMLTDICPDLQKGNPKEQNLINIPSLMAVVTLDDKKMPGTMTYNELFSMADTLSVGWISNLQRNISPDSGSNIQFTSGTTGMPKATLLSHFSSINNSFLIGKRGHFGDKQHSICTQVPLFHAFGFIIITQACLQYGTTVVLPSEWYSSDANIQAIASERCTIVGGTPTMYLDLISKVRHENFKLDTLDLAIVGGAPCSPQTFLRMKEELGIKNVKSVFGLSETTAVNFMGLDNESDADRQETIGHVHEHTEVQVIDPEGKVVPYGIPGELCVRGYCNMLGYWGDPEKTKEMIGPDRWLKTGDQVILRKDGYAQVVGRIKDMINRGGENVFPKEIEDFLYTHPDVSECHVFGVKDERLGEEICASVVLRRGSNFNYKDMVKYCQGNMANYKIPRYLRVVEGFPKTASGKIQKYKLKELFETDQI